MSFEYQYTQSQVARGTRADAETWDALVLFKRCSLLRATYEVRLLTYLAASSGKKLIIELPKGAKLDKSLQELRRVSGSTIKVRRK